MRARAILITVLLLSYGAPGARQPAVRTSIALPVPAAQLAASLGLDPEDRSHLLVSIVRLIFDAPDGTSLDDARRRGVLAAQLGAAGGEPRDRVPLPLDTSIWRETLLNPRVADRDIAAAILSDRSAALLYHGLAALDDDTLAWLGPDRDTLLHLRRHAAMFAAFGRSIRVRGGRVSVPGGEDAERLWSSIVGVEAARPGAFVQRLFRGNGRLAWLYDTVQHLDPARQRFVLGEAGTPESQRHEQVRDLLDVFETAAPEWHTVERPFVRPVLDPALVLALVEVAPGGGIAGPHQRRLWDLVFREDSNDVTAIEQAIDAHDDDAPPVEPAWLTRRISLAPGPLGRRRLETFLFAQRTFGDAAGDDASLAPALRAAAAYPALALTLERLGVRQPSTYAAAGRAAASLNAIRVPAWRRIAVAEFQSALAIVDRATRMRGLDRKTAGALAASLVALPVSAERGYGPAFSAWLRHELAPRLPPQPEGAEPIEDAVLFGLAGVQEEPAPPPIVEWEGRRYRVDPAAAELRRIRAVRERQRTARRSKEADTLDARLAASAGSTDQTRLALEQALAATLVELVYAAHLGDPDGAAASAGDAASRHELGLPDDPAAVRNGAWQLPREVHGDRAGWRVTGSLLGLDVALARLALRRLDVSDMPGEPTMSTSERASATLTAALFGPLGPSDAARKEIAAAIARGRARVAALGGDRADIERAARDAGLSEWRREALAWTLEHERERALSRFSLGELFWLGSPRGAPSPTFDAWGAATTMVDGCLCTRMPRAEPWELRTGRPAGGHLAARSADVPLRVAEVLAEMNLPSALAPSVAAYALQDVVDRARPAFFDDWPAFQRAARHLPRERLIDYIAAAAAGGPLVPVPVAPGDSRLATPHGRH